MIRLKDTLSNIRIIRNVFMQTGVGIRSTAKSLDSFNVIGNKFQNLFTAVWLSYVNRLRCNENTVYVSGTKHQSASGLILGFVENGEVLSNYIELDGGKTKLSSQGIAAHSDGHLRIDGNHVISTMFKNSYGIFGRAISAEDSVFIVNNRVTIFTNKDGSNTGSKAIHFKGTNGEISHNSVVMSTWSSYSGKTNAITTLHPSSTHGSVAHFNNCYEVKTSSAFLFFEGDSTVNIQSDRNNYYSIDSNGKKLFIYRRGSGTSFSDFNRVTKTDSNSIFLDPEFISSTNLSTRSPKLLNGGVFRPSVKFDYQNDQRSSPPDIGADEQTSVKRDIEILDIQFKSNSCKTEYRDIEVYYRNNGDSTLDSCNVTLIHLNTKDTLESKQYVKLSSSSQGFASFSSVQLLMDSINRFKAFVQIASDVNHQNDTTYAKTAVSIQKEPAKSDYEGCLNNSYIINLVGPRGPANYTWYRATSPNKVLATRSTYTLVNLQKSDSIYLQYEPKNEDSAGIYRASPPYPNGKFHDPPYNNGLVFDVKGAILLKSVDVYPIEYDFTNNRSDFWISILNDEGNVLVKKHAVINGNGRSTISFNQIIPVGKNYRMVAHSSLSDALFVENSGVKFPYESKNGDLVITGPTSTNRDSAYYPFFFNWQIQDAPCYLPIQYDVVLHPNPVPPIIDHDTVCFSDSTTMHSADTVNRIIWFSDKNLSDTLKKGVKYKAVLDSNEYIYVTAVSSFDCKSGATSVKPVMHALPPSPRAIDTSYCKGDTAIISFDENQYRYKYFNDSLGIELISDSFLVAQVGISDTFWVRRFGRCQSKQSPIILTGLQTPRFPTLVGERSKCIGEAHVIYSIDSTEIEWIDSSGSSLYSSFERIDSFQKPGQYEIYARVGTAGCKSDTSIYLYLKPRPLKPMVSPDTICPNNAINLYGKRNLKHYWFVSDTASTHFHEYDTLTIINQVADTSVYVEVDSLGCRSERINVRSVVSEEYRPLVSLTTENNYCSMDTVVAFTDEGSTVYWHYARPATGPFFVFDTVGTFDLTVYAKNRFCSSDSINKQVVVSLRPSSKFDINTSGANIRLDAREVKPTYTYTWKINNQKEGTGHSYTWKVDSNGSYDINLEVRDSTSGCSSNSDSLVPISTASILNPSIARYQVYPNPFTKLVKIRGPQNGSKLDIKLVDQNGRVVYNHTHDVNSSIDLEYLASGSYHILINSVYVTDLIKK
ncbi:MAG: T9SS type A sorting domain-containing protein [Bacteroidia bacterium]|nr:T9SS type A sorting domain-containing protein [Bacteroidia bacterium]